MDILQRHLQLDNSVACVFLMASDFASSNSKPSDVLLGFEYTF
jgi:hypothetical protein